MSTAPLSRDRVLGLPELLFPIAAHLTPPELIICVQVSHFWHEAFASSLWHTIDGRLYSWSKMCNSYNEYSDPAKGNEKSLPQRRLEWTRQVLEKYGHRIRHLSASSWIMSNLVAERGVLTQLQLLKTLWIKMYDSHNLRHLYRWIEISKTLTATEEEALKGMVRPGYTISPAFMRRALALHYRTLTSLQIGYYNRQQLDLEEYLEVLPNLQHLYTGLLEYLPSLEHLGVAHTLEVEKEEENHINGDLDGDGSRGIDDGHNDGSATPEGGGQGNPDDNSAIPDSGNGAAVGNEDARISESGSGTLEVGKEIPEGPQESSEGIEVTLERTDELPKNDGATPGGSEDTPGNSGKSHEGVDGTSKSGNETFEGINPAPEGVEETHESADKISEGAGGIPEGAEVTPSDGDHYPRSGVEGPAVHSAVSFLDRIPGRLHGFHLFDNYQRRSDSFMWDVALNIFFNLLFLTEITIDAEYPDVAPMLAKHSPVGCKDLEFFRCQLTGFCRRLDDREDWLYNETVRTMEATGYESLSEDQQRTMDKHQRRQEQHLQVYDRLASLTRLTMLDLGARTVLSWDRTYWTGTGPIRETMELSLSSGLDRLGKLENLEVFGFQGVDHRVQEPELEWMATALKTMRGLHYSYIYYKEEDEATAALREKMMALRPDVKHKEVRYKRSHKVLAVRELLDLIARHLTLDDNRSCGLVCRLWNRTTDNNYLDNIGQSCPYVKTLHLVVLDLFHSVSYGTLERFFFCLKDQPSSVTIDMAFSRCRTALLWSLCQLPLLKELDMRITGPKDNEPCPLCLSERAADPHAFKDIISRCPQMQQLVLVNQQEPSTLEQWRHISRLCLHLCSIKFDKPQHPKPFKQLMTMLAYDCWAIETLTIGHNLSFTSGVCSRETFIKALLSQPWPACAGSLTHLDVSMMAFPDDKTMV
ncbi:hypothetical protein BG015_011402 [Linnemannia schmuckeri]|uniref:F-box domain-containing protein n=1 Tax=Linnemannia schmuckeri TaxID=64567 RepID=A0A9P5S4N2_9FUNG|nr:hypothetical protein BG015_011402 [Linnemannia schmuckeri]